MSMLKEINRSRKLMGLSLLHEVKVKKHERIVLYDQPELLIVLVKSFNASCKYGGSSKTTKSSYCIAAPGNKGDYFYNTYEDIVFTYFNNYEITPEGKRGDKINWDLLQYHISTDSFTWRHAANRSDDLESEHEYPDGLIEQIKAKIRAAVRSVAENGDTIISNLRDVNPYIRHYNQQGKLNYLKNKDKWEKNDYDEKGNKIYYENSLGIWWKKKFDNNNNIIYYENSDGYKEQNKFDQSNNLIWTKTTEIGELDIINFNYNFKNILRHTTTTNDKNNIVFKIEEINPDIDDGILTIYVIINKNNNQGIIDTTIKTIDEQSNKEIDAKYEEEFINFSGGNANDKIIKELNTLLTDPEKGIQ